METETARSDRIRLFIASFLGLFIELAFIRYFPAHVRVIGYYKNIILIASFLGLGIGFLHSHRYFRMERFLLPLILVTVCIVHLFSNVAVFNPSNTDEPLWLYHYKDRMAEMSIGPVVLIHFLLVAGSLIPVGQVMGRLFGRFPRLVAYGLNLGGSFAGVAVFGALSALRAPPILWFSAITGIVCIWLCRGFWERSAALVSGGILLLFVWHTGSSEVRIWSPYYMVELQPLTSGQKAVLANKTLHQVILDFDSKENYIQKTKDRFEIPYRLSSALNDVLIVGAGTGNDVAIASAMGAKNIDAVEIDPVFPELGRKFHAQAPYSKNNVTLHVTDARAFFRNCRKRYDLIVFGTLDSQAILGHLSSIRLDNYVYTAEAFQEAYRLLKPGGLMAIFHMSQFSYIADRIYLLLVRTAKRLPWRSFYSDHTLFNNLFIQGEGLPVQVPDKQYIDSLHQVKIPTDDWPFLFLRRPTIPWHYSQVLIGMIVIAFLGSVTALKGRFRKFHPPLFFLGAGFLLLETKSVTQLSLLFGSTWKVNLLVFSSILAVLFIANAGVLSWERKSVRLNTRYLFWSLCFVLFVMSFLPISWIAGRSPIFQWVFGGCLIAVPVGMAGLIFPLIFKNATDPQAGFASNLLGAIIGGACEYLSMWLGIRSLTLTAAVFYLVAFALLIRRKEI